MAARDRVIEALDAPRTKTQRFFIGFLATLIYLSVFLVVFRERYPEQAAQHHELIKVVELAILAVFSLELGVRLAVYRQRLAYLWSTDGVVDVVAVVPALVALAVPVLPQTAWLRVFRLIRFVRLLRLARQGSTVANTGILGPILGKLMPYVALAVGLKGLLLIAEPRGWWPNLEGLSVMLGVAGFVIGTLLATKIGIAQARLYDVEDAVARVVGSMRNLFGRHDEVDKALRDWSVQFENTLSKADKRDYEAAKDRTHNLEQTLAKHGIGGPAVAGFHRDVEFVLHRSRSRTAPAFETFLRYTTVIYAAIVILALPGLTGFVGVILAIFVIGGMYQLIDDMDRVLERGPGSLIAADVTPLSEFNQFMRSDSRGEMKKALVN